jgi:hypothetical protein
MTTENKITFPKIIALKKREVLSRTIRPLSFDATRSTYKATPPTIVCCRWNVFTERLHCNCKVIQRERERKWVVVRDTTFWGWGGARNYISGFEGSQAVPACPSGIGNDWRAAL